MFEQLNDADLARKEFLEVFAGRVALGDDLDGDVRLVAVRVGHLHGRVRALAERLDDPVAVLLQYRMTLLVPGPRTLRFRRSVGRHHPRWPRVYPSLPTTRLLSRRHRLKRLRRPGGAEGHGAVIFRSAVAPQLRAKSRRAGRRELLKFELYQLTLLDVTNLTHFETFTNLKIKIQLDAISVFRLHPINYRKPSLEVAPTSLRL